MSEREEGTTKGEGVTEEDREEMLLCARYGEEEEMKELISKGVPVGTTDRSGNTALHYSAANGLMSCVRFLVKKNCPYTTNNSGNFPLNWAIQNKHKDIVKMLMKAYPEIDVLAKNDFGKSAVSEAFNVQDEGILKLILEHESANALDDDSTATTSSTSTTSTTTFSTSSKDTKKTRLETKTEPNVNPPQQQAEKKQEEKQPPLQGEQTENVDEVESSDTSKAEKSKIVQSITHEMNFNSKGDNESDEGNSDGVGPIVRVREVATNWFGSVFGKEASDDITGIQVWAASLIAARWVVDLAGELKDKSVIELGCGCGLPGLAALAYTQAKEVVLTDYFQHAIDNLKHNISINADVPNINDRSSVHAVDWTNPSTWIKDEKGEVKKFDVILGCDLVYEIDLVVPLAAIVLSILKDDGTFYYVSGGKRQGAKEFITALRDQGLECDLVPLADQYKDNPLVSKDDNQLQLHFNELHENNQLLFRFTKKKKGADKP
eukprot:m.100147 g.100147  ORF g.100147 m.100147 type:complete len:491 (-) comp12547_c0_seq28:1844-3316(-)